MTDDGYKVDSDLLEDGEHVLWAFGDLAPKRPWKYPLWVSALFLLIFGVFEVYNATKTWDYLKEAWSDPEVLKMLVIGLLIPLVILLVGLIVRKRANAKGLRPGQQSEYYVGMITNSRLVLYSAAREQDIVLRRGDIETVHLDYSNGARALRLVLSEDAALSQIIITTSADILSAKKLIEDCFIRNQVADSVEGMQA